MTDYSMLRSSFINSSDKRKSAAYLFDIDGTLAHRVNRSPYDEYSAINDDFDLAVGTTMCALLDCGFNIILLTGRKERGRATLLKWLSSKLDSRYYSKLSTILMRQDNDNRPDEIVKKEMYQLEIQNKFNVVAVFDDRDKVVNMWRSIGVKCFQVSPGHF